ncbi:MAG: ABC transporter substrate-binding protein [Ardenticatenaceae bacterium]|nr:ABC transporter substrate-binding protein [Ardenticatenaceae bacterium]
MKPKPSLITTGLLLILASLVSAACASSATPQVVKETVVVEKEKIVEKPVEVTKVVEVEVEKQVEVLITATPAAGPRQGGTVRVVGGFSDLGNFNPYSVTGPRNIYGLLFNRLIRLDANQEIQPDLADSWEISPDGLVYTFKLHPGVTWHDSYPFTAKDVAFTIRSHLDKRTNSAWTPPFLVIQGAKEFYEGKADDVPGIEVVDDLTIRFTLAEPNSAFLTAFLTPPMLPEHLLGTIAPEEIKKSAFATAHPIGTGPFKFVSYATDQYVELVRNDDYFRGVPNLDKIFLIRAEYEPAKVMLQKGEADVLDVTPLDVPSLKEKGDIQFYEVSTIGDYFVLNFCVGEPCNPPIAPKELRQAMLYALDRDQVKAVRQGDKGVLIDTLLMPPWALDNCELPNDYTYNPERAKELLQKINWDPNQELTIIHSGGWRENAITVMQQMWAAVGLKVKQEKIEWAQDRERVKDGTYQMRVDWPEQGTDPDFLSIYFGEFYPEGNNQPRYRNPELDQLFIDGRKATDRAERARIYCQIAQIINEDLPWAPLFTNAQIYGFSSRLQGVEIGHNTDYGWDLWRNVQQWWVNE